MVFRGVWYAKVCREHFQDGSDGDEVFFGRGVAVWRVAGRGETWECFDGGLGRLHRPSCPRAVS